MMIGRILGTGLLLMLFAGRVLAQPAPEPAPSTAKPDPLGEVQVDRGVDPCTDFFEYVCRPWITANPIPPDQSQWGRFNVLSIHNREALRTLLDEAAAHPTPGSQKVSDYYAACMDEDAIEQKGIAPLAAELDRVAALSDKAQLPALLAHLHDIGVGGLFEFGSEPDNKDSTISIAGIDQGGMGLPDRDYYLKTDPKSVEQRAAYQAHIARMLVLAGDSGETAATEAGTILKLETALAEGAMTKVERRDPVKVYHKLPVAALHKEAGDFNWNAYFVAAGAPGFTALNVHEPKFVATVGKVLAQTPLADIKAYLRWHLIHRAAPRLSKAFVDENFAFYGKVLSGAKELEPRWRRCVVATDGAMGEAVGKLYVETYFPGDAKSQILALIDDLKAAFAEDLRDVTWMEAKTRATALAKLEAMAVKVGYPDKWRDYSSLEIRRDDSLGNALRASAFAVHRDLHKIGTPVDRSEWDMTPPTVNAYYDPQNNDINFPAGILQPPFFDPKRDVAANYGAIGVVIGHEMTHGFDDEGHQYGVHGNLENWWSKTDEAKFKQRSACLVDEYGKFTAVDDVKVNGALTLGENTADNGGIRLALAALHRRLGTQQPPLVDGFTAEQRFFISYAQVWCGDTRPETMRLRALTDPHSPARYRVNGVVSNMPAFAQAFSCPASKPLVPQKTCRVW